MYPEKSRGGDVANQSRSVRFSSPREDAWWVKSPLCRADLGRSIVNPCCKRWSALSPSCVGSAVAVVKGGDFVGGGLAARARSHDPFRG